MAIAIALTLLAACQSADRPEETPPDYQGVTASFMTDDLIRVEAAMAGWDTGDEMRAYTDCAAAEAMALRSARYARHVRTISTLKAGIRRADAVYTVSAERPRGDSVLDAEKTRDACRATGIPGV